MHLKTYLLCLTFLFHFYSGWTQSHFDHLSQKLHLIQFDSNKHQQLFTYYDMFKVMQVEEYKSDSIVAYFTSYAIISKFGKKDTIYKTEIYADSIFANKWRNNRENLKLTYMNSTYDSSLFENIGYSGYRLTNTDSSIYFRQLEAKDITSFIGDNTILSERDFFLVRLGKYPYPNVNTVWLDGSYYWKSEGTPEVSYLGFSNYSLGIGISHHIGVWRINGDYIKNPKINFQLGYMQNEKNDKIAQANFHFFLFRRFYLQNLNTLQETKEGTYYKSSIYRIIKGIRLSTFMHLNIHGGLNYSFTGRHDMGVNLNFDLINYDPKFVDIHAIVELFTERVDYNVVLKKTFHWDTKNGKRQILKFGIGYQKLFYTSGFSYQISYFLPYNTSIHKHQIIRL